MNIKEYFDKKTHQLNQKVKEYLENYSHNVQMYKKKLLKKLVHGTILLSMATIFILNHSLLNERTTALCFVSAVIATIFYLLSLAESKLNFFHFFKKDNMLTSELLVESKELRYSSKNYLKGEYPFEDRQKALQIAYDKTLVINVLLHFNLIFYKNNQLWDIENNLLWSNLVLLEEDNILLVMGKEKTEINFSYLKKVIDMDNNILSERTEYRQIDCYVALKTKLLSLITEKEDSVVSYQKEILEKFIHIHGIYDKEEIRHAMAVCIACLTLCKKDMSHEEYMKMRYGHYDYVVENIINDYPILKNLSKEEFEDLLNDETSNEVKHNSNNKLSRIDKEQIAILDKVITESNNTKLIADASALKHSILSFDSASDKEQIANNINKVKKYFKTKGILG